MRSLIRAHPTETWLFVVLVAICAFLSFASPNFLTVANISSLLNTNARQPDLGGRPAGRSDRRRHRHLFRRRGLGRPIFERIRAFAIGGGNWFIGIVVAGAIGTALGAINAALIYYFRIISIVVTIATFNIFFGLLMFFTRPSAFTTCPTGGRIGSLFFNLLAGAN